MRINPYDVVSYLKDREEQIRSAMACETDINGKVFTELSYELDFVCTYIEDIEAERENSYEITIMYAKAIEENLKLKQKIMAMNDII